MPPVLLGYTWSKTYVPPKEECYRQNLKEYTFLTIFATIEPQLSSTENNTEIYKVDYLYLTYLISVVSTGKSYNF